MSDEKCLNCGEKIIPCKAKPGHGAPGKVKCEGWRHADTWHLCATDDDAPITGAQPTIAETRRDRAS